QPAYDSHRAVKDPCAAVEPTLDLRRPVAILSPAIAFSGTSGEGHSCVNVIFLGLVAVAFTAAAYRQLFLPRESPMPMDALSAAMIESAGSAVTLSIELIGVMTLFLGLMKVAEAGGLLVIIAKAVRPLMQRLFPDVPANHPAMGAMILNISANALGLGNAATPFGIRAMQELETLNPAPGTATNAMVLFLAINTSSLTLLPTAVIAVRAAAGSRDPAAIVPTTLFATICSIAVAIIMAKILQGGWPQPFSCRAPAARGGAESSADAARNAEVHLATPASGSYPLWVSALLLSCIVAMIPLTIVYGRDIAPWIIPGLMLALLGFGAARKVRIYEVFIEGARDGIEVALRIIPYLVAILVAVGMLRESGALAALVGPLGAVTGPVGLPAEALPMALLRPLSGSGAFGVLVSVINDPAIGPDSYTGILVSTIQGSTETTFYVIAVYFGAVSVRRMRHTIPAALSADVAGIAASVVICWNLYG
ncbi:MAG: nucleoside recognition domain-containing protein, partial [Hyphomicrobium sp.]